MKAFTYIRPTTAKEAISAFASAAEGARYIAGGTTLYDLMKLNIERPPFLIDVTAIAGLNEIDINEDRLRFGASVPMSAVASHETIRTSYPVLAESLWKAASQQLRNMATGTHPVKAAVAVARSPLV
ncbi:FAD binding domain-containing protein [Novosphingobium decolorationis]|uniref:FAD binding domain-containing protein n=1 Tax=Novosphingobium decolorationis TaxID=2698673 RepID=A0ABX8E7W8_9SPHN|nr:FAD binding domain-containing protein [Novosphingobium decolorationis]QVM85030.1 FAD binding domain-containing protein [Novosphingobium decolorationis]